MPPKDRAAAAKRIHCIFRKLSAAYPEPRAAGFGSGLDELIATVLSQHTNDSNSHEAFRRLKKSCPRWEQVAAASEAEIASCIRVAGLANVKSPRIKQILARVLADQGRYSLAALSRKPLEQAREYLLSLPGVGAKTAACVLLFAYGMPAFPVDTHILRVSKRLGLISPRTTADQAHEALGDAVPDELCHPLHLLMIQHGRRTCHARKPECPTCVLRSQCAAPLSM